MKRKGTKRMKKTIYITSLVLFAILAGCSPKVDDAFENSPIERLNINNTEKRNLLLSAPNGWIVQYFPTTGSVSSDSASHRGYSFIMDFNVDNSVTIGSPVKNVYKTATSVWDVINDNSTVLTFPTFNYIFHYYSNPDPDLNLGGDGVGLGGDYEFLLLDFNASTGCQVLKGKKNSTYNYMYPMPVGKSWPQYFKDVDAMDTLLFGSLDKTTPIDMFIGNVHLSLYNGWRHEFRAFTYGADTLGGGAYYGFLTTPDGIRIHDDVILEHAIGHPLFNLNSTKDRLVADNNPSVYLTVDPLAAFLSRFNAKKAWVADAAQFPADVQTLMSNICAGVLAKLKSSKVEIKKFSLTKKDDSKMIISVQWTATNKSGTPKDYTDDFTYNYTTSNGQLGLTLDASSVSRTNLYKYSGTAQADVTTLMQVFDGSFNMTLVQGFAPAKGIKLTNASDSSKSFVVK